MTTINADLVLPQCDNIPERIEKNLQLGMKSVDSFLNSPGSIFLLKLLRLLPVAIIEVFSLIALRYSSGLSAAMMAILQCELQTLLVVALVASILLTLDAYAVYFKFECDVVELVRRLLI